MFRKIFFYLIKFYVRNESDRLKIIDHLWEGILRDYNEQNLLGNIHNLQVEMIMGNRWIRHIAGHRYHPLIELIEKNIESGTRQAIYFIQSEPAQYSEESGIPSMIKFHQIHPKVSKRGSNNSSF